MSTFSISEEARVEIGVIVGESGCRDPVITLRDSATLDLPDALKSAAIRGMTEAESKEVQRRAEQLFEDQDASSISVEVFEREECRPEDLSEISGFTLAMTVQMRGALGEYCLKYTGGRFMLESPDEVVFNLRSVKTLMNWFT